VTLGTKADLARRWKVSPARVSELAERPDFPSVRQRIGRSDLYDLAECDRFRTTTRKPGRPSGGGKGSPSHAAQRAGGADYNAQAGVEGARVEEEAKAPAEADLEALRLEFPHVSEAYVRAHIPRAAKLARDYNATRAGLQRDTLEAELPKLRRLKGRLLELRDGRVIG
jgi:hypothetical protein